MEIEELLELEKTKKLTAKQERFCQEYILCLSPTIAYQKAYGVEYETAHKISSRLMANDGVKARIHELQDEMAKEFDVRKEYLMNQSIWVINKAKEGKPQVMMDRDGNIVPTGNTDYDMRAINDAIKNLSAITGLNVQKLQAEVNADVKTTTKIEDMAKDILDVDR